MISNLKEAYVDYDNMEEDEGDEGSKFTTIIFFSTAWMSWWLQYIVEELSINPFVSDNTK